MRHTLITLCFLLLLPAAAMAQRGLSIGTILDGRYRKNPAVTDVQIMGDRLSEYNLSYYHSLTVTDDEALMQTVCTAFLADEPKAVDKELTNVGGCLFTGIYRLTYEGTNRFVFFKDMHHAPHGAKNAVILIYMEGDTSLKSLQKKFKK